MFAVSLKHFVLSVVIAMSVIMYVISLLTYSQESHPLSQSAGAMRFSRRYNRGQLLPKHIGQDEDSLTLERILRKASMPDKTVIITTLNQAWATSNTMIDLFLESFRIGDNITRYLDHLVIVTLDQRAYERCITIHMYCFQLKTEGIDFSGEKLFMTSDYLRMMWRRIEFLRQVLEEGYSFVFSDADIMWVRDPFPYFSSDADFQMACDYYNGYPKSIRNRANGGFIYARSNKRTIEFYKYWYMAREVFPGKHDQDVFNKIKRDEALSEIGLRIEFFDTRHISGFCQLSHDLDKVVTVHANCCYGMQSKLNDLRLILADWRRYSNLPPSEKRVQRFSWSVPKDCLTSHNLLQ